MSIDMELLLDSMRHVESGDNPNAVSPKGAMGPYQFMPETAKEFGLKNPFNESEARDAARRKMTGLIKMFGGNAEQAIAAYNGGEGRLQSVGGNIAEMPHESQQYVTRVMSHYGNLVLGGDPERSTAPQNQPVAPVDALFPGEQGSRQLSATRLFPNNHEDDVLTASVLDPKPIDQATRIYNMQLRTGLPAGLIERNLDEIEQKAKQEDFNPDQFRKESPILAKWLSENSNRASLAQGDYENLSALEKTWATFQAIPQGFDQGIQTQRLMELGYKAVTGEITPQEEIERQKLNTELNLSSQQNTQGLPSWVGQAAQIVGLQVPMAEEAAKKGIGFGLPAGALLGAAGGAAAGPPGALAGAAAGGVAGFQSAFQASYIDQTYKLSVGDVYSDLETAKDASGKPLDPTVARYASLVAGVPNALLEFASLRTAVKMIPGADSIMGKIATSEMKKILVRPSVMEAMKDFGKKYAAAVGTETFTEGMQKFVNIIAREIATGDNGAGLSAQDAKAIAAESEAAFKGTVVLGALGSGPKVIELYANMEKADQNEQFMRNLGDVAANSKTFANSPKAFGDYVKSLTENGQSVKDVYIPVEKWDQLFQDGAPNAAAEVYGDLKQYSEAKVTGGDLVIPLETYAEKLAGTPFHEKLIPDIRLNPGELTPNEAAFAAKSEPIILEGLKRELADKVAEEAPLTAIYQDVYSKLKQIGASNQEAVRDATITRERLRARAERLGVDPMALYQEKPLIVQREYPAAVADQLATYNQQLAEPAVPYAQRLPLHGGETNLPPASPQEHATAQAALDAASFSEKEHGVFGATIHQGQGNLAGKEGVAVAGYPQRGVITEGKPTVAELETFQRRNRDIFQADPHAALGVWVDQQSGKGYIDITNVLPRDAAIAQGEHLGELAVWDLHKGEEIRLPTQGKSTQGMLFQGERGASVPIKNLIALLKNADASTFMHESAHLWLEELRQDALRPDAPAQLKADWETIKNWIGAADDKIPTDAHETFARGFEAYLMEGKAPSFQLREVFAQLKDWLSRIYKSMQMLGVELKPDVTDVMDRLIATDEAIKQAHERNSYDVNLLNETDMTGPEYAAYTQLSEEAKRTAEDTFRAKVMKELQREKTQEWRDEKKALYPKVRQEILAQPVYRAAYWLWSGVLPDGTKIENMAATKLDKQALLDMGVTLTDLPFRYQENGLHPDVVAELFGFPSGETLVRDLIGLPTLKETIDNEVSRRIREAHGGIIVQGTSMEEAAMEVQNTRQIDVFNMELRILKRMGAKREISHPAVMKDIARQIISRKALKDLNPRVFEEAANKAANEAQVAMLGRDFRMGTGRNLDKAFDAKQKQMLNIYLFKEATAQRMEADKSIAEWKKFVYRGDERLAKTNDMNMINTARAILSVHGIGGSADTAASYMNALAQYDPDLYSSMNEIVTLASSDGRQVEDMTVADFGTMRDAVDGLRALARRSRQVEIDGKKMEKDEVVGQLNTRISELVKPGTKRAGYNRDLTKWDRTKMGFLGAMAQMRRVEHWVDSMDNGDPNGVFRKYIWQPVSEAADRYRDARRLTLEKYQEIVKSVPKDTFKNGKIDAPEINYTFDNKAKLIGALMHTGNQSNLQKLLRGKEWGTLTPEGELDSHNWDAFIQRMHDQGVITKADYDFVQQVWDLMESLKPGAQKAHKEMYGYYFDEITAKPFQTPFGEYKGGYYPATADPFLVEDAAIRADKEALENKPSSFMFPTTGRGFTKKRSEMYARPLSLDLGMIPNNIGKVLRFTHLEPVVKDIGRIGIDKNFRNHLADLDTEVATNMLMPWLQRSALQMVEFPSGPRSRMVDAFFHNLRANTGLQIMAGNVSVALQQLSGLSLSAMKVSPRYLAGALWRYTSSPRQYADHINESSSFMRNRLSTQIMEISRSIDNITLNPSAYEKARDFAREHGHFMQSGMQNVVDVITWGGAYEQATQQGMDEKAAVRVADSAVRETQGTFHAEDISNFETGTAFKRAFTMFYSYFNMAANLNATEFTKALRQSGFTAAGRALYIYAFGFMIPAVLSEAISQMVSGQAFDPGDDDSYLDNILSMFFGGQAKMGTAMIPLVGPAIQAGINMFDDKWYNDDIKSSPAVNSIKSMASVPLDAWKVATDSEARLKRPIQDVLTTVGVVTGLPLGVAARPLGYMTDVSQGHIQQSDNPAEIARGLISGRAPK